MTKPRVKRKDLQRRLEIFKRSVAMCGGDVGKAITAWTQKTPAKWAEVMGLPRQTVQQCLKNSEGRSYGHVRRALEAELQLPAYSLDQILDTTH